MELDKNLRLDLWFGILTSNLQFLMQYSYSSDWVKLGSTCPTLSPNTSAQHINKYVFCNLVGKLLVDPLLHNDVIMDTPGFESLPPKHRIALVMTFICQVFNLLSQK